MILIHGGVIVDGTGAKPKKGDVLIRGERISAIGDFHPQSAADVIDARGCTIVPGFIDVNSDSDHYLTLFTNPEQGTFLRQGITTTIGGNCGSSLAPLLYGSLESIRKWTDVNRVNVGWQSVKEFLSILSHHGIGINFGTLVGHATIRRALIGEVFRDLTEGELRVFERVISDALRDGALGLSTGLGYVHARGAPHHEIRRLVALVASRGGVYATHLRDEAGGIEHAVREALTIARETKAKTIISHFRPIHGFEHEFSQALELIETSSGENIHFDSYPFNASLVSIYTLLPDWAKQGNLESMHKLIDAPHMKERLLKALPVVDLFDIQVVDAPGAEYLNGVTLHEFSRNHGIRAGEALLALMKATKLRATVIYKNVNMDLAIQSLLSPHALVASNCPSFPVGPATRHERVTSAFTKFLSDVTGGALMPLEKAIQKLTQTPAATFGIRDRGEIQEGYFADIVILKDGVPRDVLVNGTLALRDKELMGTRAGKTITRA